MPSLIAYHGKPAIKKKYLARVRAHAKADEIIKGQYWEGGKGCAVGCTIHSSDHADYETELGVPVEIAHLEDVIFEGLPEARAQKWPLRFLKAIEPGADLSLVWDRFALRLLTDTTCGMTVPVKDAPYEIAEIKGVAALYERTIAGEKVPSEEWYRAARAAGAAREAWAAWEAWEARAAREAWEAWEAGAARAARAAWEAWEAGAARAAREARAAGAAGEALWEAWEAWAAGTAREAGEAYWTRCSDWLIELIEAAPVKS